MSPADLDPEADFDARLKELERAKNAAIDRCHYRTAIRLAAEEKRTARAARRLEPYVWALHTMMNHAESVLEPDAGQDAAVELIAVLESEERARQIQPDIDGSLYEWVVSRVSSCAYDGMGRLVALARGYNSEGVHETVAEGIQVCRRTGKLECILCFRNYASDVDRAADDLDMAIHHARQVAATGNVNENFDRRWAGASEEAALQLIAGQVGAAETAIRQAREFIPTYHNPTSAGLKAAVVEATIGLLRNPDHSALAELDALAAATPPSDEYPSHSLELAQLQALQAAVRGDHAAAIATLTPWDRRLLDAGCLDLWFEARLRLIAAHHLAGQADRAAGLVRQLESKARVARDWLTLRRLKRVLDPDQPTAPIAPAGPITLSQPAPIADAAGAETGGGIAASVEPTQSGAETISPLRDTIHALVIAMVDAGDDAASRAKLIEAVTGFGPDLATHPLDVASLIHLARNLADDPASAVAVWDWAERLAAPWPRDGGVLNALGALGDSLRSEHEEAVGDRIDPTRLEALIRSSLDLDPDDAGNFYRGALHHARAGRMGEAERCLTRVLRLDRTNSRAALWLTRIYNTSDRSADALTVLDLTLRAGSTDSDVAWEAVGLAHSLGQNEALLTYLDRYDAAEPTALWSHYYRASGLLRLGRSTEALAAIDEEARRNPASRLAVLALRACGLAALNRAADLRSTLSAVLTVRLAEVDYLTHAGLLSLAERLWDAVAPALPGDEPLPAALGERLLDAGLTPNSYFAAIRSASPKLEEQNFYVCFLDQPLDARWADSPGCLAGEAEWTQYRIGWGVLAASEADAIAAALAWQGRCAPLAATVASVQLRSEGFTDAPGIVWQGVRGQAEEPE